MPLYEYQCRACGTRFERIQKYSDPPIDKCPACGGDQVEKLLSSPAIQFKGSGFYITDYARKSDSGEKSRSSSGDKAGKAETTSASDGKSESKSDSKSESTPAADTKAAPKPDAGKS